MQRYYNLIATIKPRIETFTERKWDCPSFDEIPNLGLEFEPLSNELRQGNLPGREYMVYPRHHGFPSPLLDWTRSPYIAGYFAFREIQQSEAVSIYIFEESPDDQKARTSSKPSIYSIGPQITSHKRHFLQQAAYSVCVQFDHPGGWHFESHEKVFEKNNNIHDFRQDDLTKVTIPSTERIEVLKSLEEHNLNAFSLFGSEESLMETLAIQDFDFLQTVPNRIFR